MKNDTIFVRMRSGDHLGDAKMSKKGTSFRSNLTFFINSDRQKRFLQNLLRRADLQTVSQFFNFLPRDLVMIFQLHSLMMILPLFSTLKDHN